MKRKLYNVTILGQDHKGRGIARIDDKVIFVKGALPDEICNIEIVKDTKKFQEAIVLEKKERKSIIPTCPYYEACGGCNILHQKYEEQLRFKEKKVQEILQKFAGIKGLCNPIIYDRPLFYRNKITLHNLGLYQSKTNNVIKIKECQLVDERINKVIKRLQKYSKKSTEKISKAIIRVSNQGEILLDLSLSGKFQIENIQQNFQDLDVLIVNQICLTKKNYIIDQINHLKFQISSASFYQVNRFVTAKLYQLVVNVYQRYSIKNLLDLYCGTGTISLLVSPCVEKVVGIEVIQEAVENANENKRCNNIQNVEFICGKVEDYIEQFQNFDGIILDPPRSGLDSKTLSTILQILPKIITYVSCDPVTLARDLKELMSQYEMIEITPVDMFPNTYHVECVCVLNRR